MVSGPSLDEIHTWGTNLAGHTYYRYRHSTIHAEEHESLYVYGSVHLLVQKLMNEVLSIIGQQQSWYSRYVPHPVIAPKLGNGMNSKTTSWFDVECSRGTANIALFSSMKYKNDLKICTSAPWLNCGCTSSINTTTYHHIAARQNIHSRNGYPTVRAIVNQIHRRSPHEIY